MVGFTEGRNIKYSPNAKFFFGAAMRVFPQKSTSDEIVLNTRLFTCCVAHLSELLYSCLL